MSINRLYHTWLDYIRQLYPGERITRLRNLAWLLVGIDCSKSVHLSQIAVHIPGAARSPSIVRRLSLFQIGLRWVVRRLTNPWLIPIRLTPIRSSKLSGG